MFATLERAVVRIPNRSNTGWGAGFFVEDGRYLLTCHHVAADGIDAYGLVTVETRDDPHSGVSSWKSFARPVPNAKREAADLCLLELMDAPPSFVTPLSLINEPLLKGQRLHSRGFPILRQGFSAAASATFLGGTFDPATEQPIYEVTSHELTGGYSGAPVVLETSTEVIGVMTATAVADPRGRFESHAWLIPTHVIAATSPELEVRPAPFLRDLQAFAWERAPHVLDYALGVSDGLPEIQPTLRPNLPDDSSALTPRECLEALKRSGKQILLLRGPAGGGKSLALRAWFARLAAFEADGGGLGKEHIPIYLRAGSLAAASGSMPERLLAALHADGLVRQSVAISAGYLQSLLKWRLPILVLVDGLDEIVDPLRRAHLAQDLVAWSDELAAAGHTLVIATRDIAEADRIEQASHVRRQMI